MILNIDKSSSKTNNDVLLNVVCLLLQVHLQQFLCCELITLGWMKPRWIYIVCTTSNFVGVATEQRCYLWGSVKCWLAQQAEYLFCPVSSELRRVLVSCIWTALFQFFFVFFCVWVLGNKVQYLSKGAPAALFNKKNSWIKEPFHLDFVITAIENE